MIKKYFMVLAATAFLFLVYKYSFHDNDEVPDDMLPVTVVSYRTASGWGYEIDVDGKKFIHQDNIPAVQGNKSFRSSADALKVGSLVVDKMKNNKKPVISVEDLKTLRIML